VFEISVQCCKMFVMINYMSFFLCKIVYACHMFFIFVSASAFL
jgi:hypothetical protein